MNDPAVDRLERVASRLRHMSEGATFLQMNGLARVLAELSDDVRESTRELAHRINELANLALASERDNIQ